MIIGTSTRDENMDTGGAEALLTVIDLDNYKKLYGRYIFFQTDVVDNNNAMHVASNNTKFYFGAVQAPSPRPDATGRSVNCFNK